MTGRFKGHFDGKVIVPEGPIDLPVGESLEFSTQPTADAASCDSTSDRPLMNLVDRLRRLGPIEGEPLPTDLAAQHDHYLYGTPKRP